MNDEKSLLYAFDCYFWALDNEEYVLTYKKRGFIEFALNAEISNDTESLVIIFYGDTIQVMTSQFLIRGSYDRLDDLLLKIDDIEIRFILRYAHKFYEPIYYYYLAIAAYIEGL